MAAAEDQTSAQFRFRARRLREKQYPETIVERQLTAFEQRKVCLEPDTDGMSWLSALLLAEKAQSIFIQLSKAARGEQAAGDPRTVDQLLLAKRPKPQRLDVNHMLLIVVAFKLGQDWSPEQISHWLRRAYPEDASMRLSHEAIYRSIYIAERKALAR